MQTDSSSPRPLVRALRRALLGTFLALTVSGLPAVESPSRMTDAPSTEATGFADAADQTRAAGSAWIIPIRGDIEKPVLAFIRRETRRALDAGASWLIYDIDTFGGRVDTALQISSFIGSVDTAGTIAWVRGGPDSMGVSWSAGALIAFSCKDIYMANGTSMGAAAPITVGPSGQSEGAGEKTVSAVRSQMAAIAEKNGHPPLLALAMVDYDVEIWEINLDGATRLIPLDELERMEAQKNANIERVKLVSASGKLLSLTAGEALRYGLLRGIADDNETLLGALGAAPVPVETIMTISDRIVAFLTSSAIQTILILIALVCLYLELNAPGFGIFGVISLVSFLVVFGSGLLLGTVGSLELILFLLGIALLAVELFLLPGFGVAGISGILLIATALILSMQDFIIPALPWQWNLMGRNVLVVAVGVFTAIIGIAGLLLSGHRIRLFRALTLTTTIQGTAAEEGAPDPVPEEETGHRQKARNRHTQDDDLVHREAAPHPLVGHEGVATTIMRPVGKARIDGIVRDVETDGTFLEAGTPVLVIQVQGSKILVEKKG